MRIIDVHAHIFERAEGYPYGYTVRELVEDMDKAGVSAAVILQNPTYGSINDYVRIALDSYSERFVGTIQVDPLSVDSCTEIERYASPLQNSLKLEISEGWGWSGKYPGLSLLDDRILKMFDTVSRLGLRVIIDPGPVGGNGYQVENIAELARRYPDTKILVEHLGYLTPDRRDAASMARWRQMIALGRDFANVFFGTSAVGTLLEEPYPCTGSQELIREATETMGAGKLMWGSDLPSTFKEYTYMQMADVILKECTFLSDDDKVAIMGLNAVGFFGFKP